MIIINELIHVAVGFLLSVVVFYSKKAIDQFSPEETKSWLDILQGPGGVLLMALAALYVCFLIIRFFYRRDLLHEKKKEQLYREKVADRDKAIREKDEVIKEKNRQIRALIAKVNKKD